MKKIVAILCVFMVFSACKAGSNSSTKGNKKITSIEKSITNYSDILIAGSCDVIYEQNVNSKAYLRIEIDENLQQYVKAEVNNGTLKISLDGQNIRATKFRAYTNSPSLSIVKISGSGDVTLKNKVVSPSLEISISGSGDLIAENIQSDNLKISISGSGDVRASGRVTNSNISIQGSGDVDALGLVTKNTRCSIQGSGDAKVQATNELSAQVSGSGDIRFKGNPKKLNKSVKGSGSISKI